MLDTPFDITSCSWPRSILQKNNEPLTEPDWQLPLMPVCPPLEIKLLQKQWYWSINWSDFFRCNLPVSRKGNEMRGFYVVFEIQFKKSGRFSITPDQNCVLRRRGQVIFDSRVAATAKNAAFTIEAGETLQIAQWHSQGEWVWISVFYDQASTSNSFDPLTVLKPYLDSVHKRLQHPTGPPLKIYTNGQSPLRIVVGIYSIILNGYAPSALYLFGDYQWNSSTADLFRRLLPFAQIVSVNQVLSRLQEIGGSLLLDPAMKHWYVMKLIVALFYPPDTFCFMDDDVFVLESLDDALEAFKEHDLVYTMNYGINELYREVWGSAFKDLPASLPTARFNAGLYLMRNKKASQVLLAALLQIPATIAAHIWEQGFIAAAFANDRCFELPSQRYFAPALDGFPGGLMGYDYARNPCEFICIHFMAVEIHAKPSDAQALRLLPQLCKNVSV